MSRSFGFVCNDAHFCVKTNIPCCVCSAGSGVQQRMGLAAAVAAAANEGGLSAQQVLCLCLLTIMP